MPVSTGSDTRMYAPRSESNLGYTKDPEDNPHGIGDPETMEQERDKRMLEQERQQTISDLPHLQLDVPNPNPTPPPPLPGMDEEDEPVMDDDNENARGAEVSQLTGMPDTGNLSIGNATGTMPQPGGMLATGEPMDIAWRLLKEEDGVWDSRGFPDGPQEQRDYEMWSKWQDELEAMVPTLQPDDVLTPEGEWKEAPNNPFGPDHYYHGNNWNQATGGFTPEWGFNDLYEIAQRKEAAARRKEAQRETEWLQAVEEAKSFGIKLWPGDLQAKDLEALRDRIERVRTSEPMDDAWSELMKARKNLKNMGSSSVRPWKQPQYKIQPGGADISTATSRRSKLHSRHLQPHKHRGIDRAPLSVHRSHLGIATKQPLRLFPQKYGQQMGSMSRRKWQGNIPSGHPSGHAMGPETTYSPKTRSTASSAGLNIRAPTGPKLRGQNMGIKNTMKSEDIAGIKEDLTLLRKEMNYMHFAQMRRLMRKIKEAMANKERRLKAAVSSGPGEKGKAGHMEGQDKTTRPEGATEDLKNIPESWGAPSSMFVAPGSGRVG